MKLLTIILISISLLNSCSREGCRDSRARNYDHGKNVKTTNELCEYDEVIKATLTKTIIEGDIDSPTVWPKIIGADVDYIVTGQIDISSTLTIEAGVTIQFNENGYLNSPGSYGRLYFNGTASNPINLTSTGISTYWKGINFRAEYQKAFELKYVNISKTSVNFQYSPIKIVLPNANCIINLKNCHLFDCNNSCGVSFSTNTTAFDFTGTTFTGFTQDYCF